MQQIIAMGGGGFLMEPDNLALDRYILQQTNVERPKVCFLPQASCESPDFIIHFYRTFTSLGAEPSHLSLFKPHTADIEDFLLSQHAIYVGGGNTKSMLALWREWELDRMLLKAAEANVVLAGISAGAICWFEQATTDSIPGKLTLLRGLGYLKGACSPHYDGEVERRPAYHALIGAGEIELGVAFDDGAAGHYVDGELVRVVSSRPNAKGYRVERTEGGVTETVLETQYLNAAEDSAH